MQEGHKLLQMNESRQPFTIHQARKNTISLEDFKRMMLKRAKVQAVADILAPNGSGNVEDDGVHVPATEFSQLMNAPMSGVTSDAFEAALNAASQQQLKQQQLHPLAATRRGHLVQSRKEVNSCRPKEREQYPCRHPHDRPCIPHRCIFSLGFPDTHLPFH